MKEIYLVTDYVDGTTLAKLTKKIKRNYPVIIRILVNVAYGMRYMNSVNMLHRDIKLDNVLVSFNNKNNQEITKKSNFYF